MRASPEDLQRVKGRLLPDHTALGRVPQRHRGDPPLTISEPNGPRAARPLGGGLWAAAWAFVGSQSGSSHVHRGPRQPALDRENPPGGRRPLPPLSDGHCPNTSVLPNAYGIREDPSPFGADRTAGGRKPWFKAPKTRTRSKSRMTSKLRPPGFFRKTDLNRQSPETRTLCPRMTEWAWPTAPPSPLQKDGR